MWSQKSSKFSFISLQYRSSLYFLLLIASKTWEYLRVTSPPEFWAYSGITTTGYRDNQSNVFLKTGALDGFSSSSCKKNCELMYGQKLTDGLLGKMSWCKLERLSQHFGFVWLVDMRKINASYTWIDTFSTLIMLWFFFGASAVNVKLVGHLTWVV